MHTNFGYKAWKEEVLGRSRSAQQDNIKMEFKEMSWEVVHWIQQSQDGDRWKGHCEHGNELLGSVEDDIY